MDTAERVVRRWKIASVNRVRIDPGERSDYQDQVWDMYTASYRAIGLIASSPSELMEFDVWDMFMADDKPVAFSLAKHTRWGVKAGLLGSDGSSEGKSAVKHWITARLKMARYYAEVSHAVERLSQGAPVVCAVWVPKVLGKPINPMPDGIHYERNIVGVGSATKMMVGNPRGVPSGISCPVGIPVRHAAIAADESRASVLSHWACHYDPEG